MRQKRMQSQNNFFHHNSSVNLNGGSITGGAFDNMREYDMRTG